MKTALITGVTGQDGAYLAQLLLGKGYRVVGTFRRTSSVNFWRLQWLGIAEHPQLVLRECDLTDLGSIVRTISACGPDEVYNLAAQSFVGVSFDQPIATAHISGVGALHVLEAVRLVDRNIRVYQASTSEMFGKAEETPQKETTRFHPRSPYGVAKLFAHWSAINYRESHGLFAANGILFNHESPLRGPEFVTRKITLAAARAKKGDCEPLRLGNLCARRDWGYAPEYVDGMWRMLQRERPDDYVLATGRSETVREFAAMAFAAAGIALEWHGKGSEERARCSSSGRICVEVDPAYFRPAEVDTLIGDPAKAEAELGWKATTSLEQLCRLMVEADVAGSNRVPND